MNKINKLTGQLADNLVRISKELKEDFITGETNLKLTKEELERKMLKLKNGKSYLGVLQWEHNILERQGVVKGAIVDGEVMFDIPDWDNFISRVNAFHEACGPYF